jgi:hypothetical protein
MKHYLNLILYYFLLLTGLCVTSWLIYTRFIRERVIRDIPDLALTEIRFWVLFYLCCIYIFIIKSLLKRKPTNVALEEIIDFIYKPMIVFDHSLKYNTKIRPYYYKLMLKISSLLPVLDGTHVYLIIIFMQIIPRIILVIFLVLDTFYFNKLEIFYKVVLIGLVPLIFRYIKYTLKDMQEYWLKELEQQYVSVKLYEKGFHSAFVENFHKQKRDVNAKQQPTAQYHDRVFTVREACEILYEHYLEQYVLNYEYDASPQTYEKFIFEIIKKKYKPEIIELTKTDLFLLKYNDFQSLREFYDSFMPMIINIKVCLYKFRVIDESKSLQIMRILIFSLYLICWSYILIISYWHTFIPLTIGLNYLISFLTYLGIADNHFAEMHWGSLAPNMLTWITFKFLFKIFLKKTLTYLLYYLYSYIFIILLILIIFL